MELEAAQLLAVIANLLSTYGPIVLIAYGIFFTVMLILVVAVFVTVLRGFWQHDKYMNQRRF